MTEDRYSRQRKLAEVGDTGQARIEGTSFEVRGQDGADVERAYLERAGVRAVTLAPGRATAPFRHAAHFRFPATRSVGAGAWRALAQLRPLLNKGGLPPRLADATAPLVQGGLAPAARFATAPLVQGGLAPAARFATAPPPPPAGSLRSRGSDDSAPLPSLGDDEVVDAELVKERRP